MDRFLVGPAYTGFTRSGYVVDVNYVYTGGRYASPAYSVATPVGVTRRSYGADSNCATRALQLPHVQTQQLH